MMRFLSLAVIFGLRDTMYSIYHIDSEKQILCSPTMSHLSEYS
jgi:hypothetical protein